MKQLIVDIEPAQNVELIKRLDELVARSSNLFYDVLLWPVPQVRRDALVRFRSRNHDQLRVLAFELALAAEDQEAARERIINKITGV